MQRNPTTGLTSHTGCMGWALRAKCQASDGGALDTSIYQDYVGTILNTTATVLNRLVVSHCVLMGNISASSEL